MAAGVVPGTRVGRAIVRSRWPSLPLHVHPTRNPDAPTIGHRVTYYLPPGWDAALDGVWGTGTTDSASVLDALEVLAVRVGPTATRLLAQEGPDVYLAALRALGADVTRRP